MAARRPLERASLVARARRPLRLCSNRESGGRGT
ncbi:hypothetical protein BPC006_I3063 [Burkholderia pseudomallei BPC006]|nr:hypothetical protein BPC006_I3063 [Burkholderia pseudomallei BPC006]